MGVLKRFSVITPVHLDNIKQFPEELLRCVESVAKQNGFNLSSIEYLIINDGSTISVEIPKYPYIKVINQTNQNRVTAYNMGLKESSGEIVCFLDSDDELDPNYLHTIDNWFNKYPKYKLFNFGARYIHKDGGTREREVFIPKKKKEGHVSFGGGNIVNGTFVFHREVYEKLGGFPPHNIKGVDCSSINYPAGGEMVRDLQMASPYDFSAAAQLEFPEIRKYFMVDMENEPNKVIKELGNPWGQDWYLFYKYTRVYHSKPMRNNFLYVVHP